MAAYVLSEVEVLEEESFEQYRALARASIELPEAAEGDWPSPRRLVILEFPDMATARRWYSSESYAKALAFRDRGLSRRLVFVDGV